MVTMPTTTIVCGPPCAGKNHYVDERSKPGDVVIDWDAIAVELGSPKQHNHPKPMYAQIAAEYDRRLDQLEQQAADRDVWIIRGMPEHSERREWSARFNADVVVLTPPLDILMQRARERGHAVGLTEWSIRKWFERADKDPAPLGYAAMAATWWNPRRSRHRPRPVPIPCPRRPRAGDDVRLLRGRQPPPRPLPGRRRRRGLPEPGKQPPAPQRRVHMSCPTAGLVAQPAPLHMRPRPPEERPMSAEAWGAFLESLLEALHPIAVGAWVGWLLRGGVDARRRRMDHAQHRDPQG